MKTFKDRNGFTLVELLAVIVVLAIVTVLATRSILPYMQNAGRDTFAIQANDAITGASDAMSLISLGEISSENYTKFNDGGVEKYCFTLKNLNDIGLWIKDDDTYQGTVVVTPNGAIYTYSIEMYNNDYYVKTTSGQIKSDETDVSKNGVADVTDSIKSSLKTSCP